MSYDRPLDVDRALRLHGVPDLRGALEHFVVVGLHGDLPVLGGLVRVGNASEVLDLSSLAGLLVQTLGVAALGHF
jgi:hypothetical protein